MVQFTFSHSYFSILLWTEKPLFGRGELKDEDEDEDQQQARSLSAAAKVPGTESYMTCVGKDSSIFPL